MLLDNLRTPSRPRAPTPRSHLKGAAAAAVVCGWGGWRGWGGAAFV